MSTTPTQRQGPDRATGGCGVLISPEVRDRLIKEVAPKHGLRPAELLTHGRNVRIARARQEVMWRLRSLRAEDGRPKHSYPAIARSLSLGDHTTVIFGVRAHAARSGL